MNETSKIDSKGFDREFKKMLPFSIFSLIFPLPIAIFLSMLNQTFEELFQDSIWSAFFYLILVCMVVSYFTSWHFSLKLALKELREQMISEKLTQEERIQKKIRQLGSALLGIGIYMAFDIQRFFDIGLSYRLITEVVAICMTAYIVFRGLNNRHRTLLLKSMIEESHESE